MLDTQNANLTISCDQTHSLFDMATNGTTNAPTRLNSANSTASISIFVHHKLTLETAPVDAYSHIPSGAATLILGAISSSSSNTTTNTSTTTTTTTTTTSAAITAASVTVRSGYDFSMLPRVLGDSADLIPIPNSTEAPDLGPVHASKLRKGLLDITLPPFSADKAGVTDSTVAIQHALDYAYANYLIVHFPIGRYGARFLAGIYTLGCHWFPSLLV
jgi:hypothetical protein